MQMLADIPRQTRTGLIFVANPNIQLNVGVWNKSTEREIIAISTAKLLLMNAEKQA
jgi:hypothetical protein